MDTHPTFPDASLALVCALAHSIPTGLAAEHGVRIATDAPHLVGPALILLDALRAEAMTDALLDLPAGLVEDAAQVLRFAAPSIGDDLRELVGEWQHMARPDLDHQARVWEAVATVARRDEWGGLMDDLHGTPTHHGARS